MKTSFTNYTNENKFYELHEFATHRQSPLRRKFFMFIAKAHEKCELRKNFRILSFYRMFSQSPNMFSQFQTCCYQL